MITSLIQRQFAPFAASLGLVLATVLILLATAFPSPAQPQSDHDTSPTGFIIDAPDLASFDGRWIARYNSDLTLTIYDRDEAFEPINLAADIYPENYAFSPTTALFAYVQGEILFDGSLKLLEFTPTPHHIQINVGWVELLQFTENGDLVFVRKGAFYFLPLDRNLPDFGTPQKLNNGDGRLVTNAGRQPRPHGGYTIQMNRIRWNVDGTTYEIELPIR